MNLYAIKCKVGSTCIVKISNTEQMFYKWLAAQIVNTPENKIVINDCDLIPINNRAVIKGGCGTSDIIENEFKKIRPFKSNDLVLLDIDVLN